jgi:Outer membrane protein
VILSVRESYVALSEAQEGVAVALEAQRYAKERLDLAMGRFRAGVGNSLEVSDAIESFANSQNSVVQSLYDSKIAQLNLEYAIGGMVQ